jgi:Uma2 family endonuclease
MDTARQRRDHPAEVKSMSDMLTETKRRRLSATEYLELIDREVLGPDDRVELIGGELIPMPPQNPPHGSTIARINAMFRRLPSRVLVWSQITLVAGEDFVPDPDFVLLRPRTDFYGSKLPHAADAFAVVEVSHTTLAKDRGEKLRGYAAAGIGEYWIANVKGGVIEVHREPHASGYVSKRIAKPGETVAFAAFPDVVFTVDELLG